MQEPIQSGIITVSQVLGLSMAPFRNRPVFVFQHWLCCCSLKPSESSEAWGPDPSHSCPVSQFWLFWWPCDWRAWSHPLDKPNLLLSLIWPEQLFPSSVRSLSQGKSCDFWIQPNEDETPDTRDLLWQEKGTQWDASERAGTAAVEWIAVNFRLYHLLAMWCVVKES